MTDLDTVISLGAGVQSTTLALMAAAGELDDLGPRPRLAIFADTGWEPRAVYEHLDRLQPALKAAGIEVARVTVGNIRDAALEGIASGGKKRFASIPLHTKRPDGQEGIGRRQCTREFKLDPIYRELRARGYGGGRKDRREVTQYLGISLDEIQRMKPARIPWAHNAYPLVDKRMTRHDCQLWLERNGHGTAPRSACIGCPFHGNDFWRDLRDNSPSEWDDAVAFDHAIRRYSRLEGESFLHRDRIPLDQVDLSTPEDAGQGNLFDAECEGMCGV